MNPTCPRRMQYRIWEGVALRDTSPAGPLTPRRGHCPGETSSSNLGRKGRWPGLAGCLRPSRAGAEPPQRAPAAPTTRRSGQSGPRSAPSRALAQDAPRTTTVAAAPDRPHPRRREMGKPRHRRPGDGLRPAMSFDGGEGRGQGGGEADGGIWGFRPCRPWRSDAGDGQSLSYFLILKD